MTANGYEFFRPKANAHRDRAIKHAKVGIVTGIVCIVSAMIGMATVVVTDNWFLFWINAVFFPLGVAATWVNYFVMRRMQNFLKGGPL